MRPVRVEAAAASRSLSDDYSASSKIHPMHAQSPIFFVTLKMQ